jgi:chromosome segregation ATPase
MLDAFKKNGTARQQQADELQALIAASKEERAALSTMLTQVQMHSAKLATAGKSQQEVEAKAAKIEARINALADAVSQAEHTVEHAVVEANRLNEMVWAMEVQINKLNEGGRQATRTEELIDRVDKLAREVGGQLDSGLKAKDAFASDLARLEKDRAALTDFVRGYTDTLALERKEFEAFGQRVKVLQAAVGEAEKGIRRRKRAPAKRKAKLA